MVRVAAHAPFVKSDHLRLRQKPLAADMNHRQRQPICRPSLRRPGTHHVNVPPVHMLLHKGSDNVRRPLTLEAVLQPAAATMSTASAPATAARGERFVVSVRVGSARIPYASSTSATSLSSRPRRAALRRSSLARTSPRPSLLPLLKQSRCTRLRLLRLCARPRAAVLEPVSAGMSALCTAAARHVARCVPEWSARKTCTRRPGGR